jgi:hypothetical protein
MRYFEFDTREAVPRPARKDDGDLPHLRGGDGKGKWRLYGNMKGWTERASEIDRKAFETLCYKNGADPTGPVEHK